jgi:hypothetical protein
VLKVQKIFNHGKHRKHGKENNLFSVLSVFSVVIFLLYYKSLFILSRNKFNRLLAGYVVGCGYFCVIVVAVKNGSMLSCLNIG